MSKDEKVAAVVTDLRDETLTLAQVATKHGISGSTVQRIAKQHNITRRKGRPWGVKSHTFGVSDYLSEDETRTWHMIESMCPPGFLQPSDRLCFDLLTRLATPLYMGKPISKSDMRLLTRLAGKYGFTVGDGCLVADIVKQHKCMGIVCIDDLG